MWILPCLEVLSQKDIQSALASASKELQASSGKKCNDSCIRVYTNKKIYTNAVENKEHSKHGASYKVRRMLSASSNLTLLGSSIPLSPKP